MTIVIAGLFSLACTQSLSHEKGSSQIWRTPSDAELLNLTRDGRPVCPDASGLSCWPWRAHYNLLRPAIVSGGCVNHLMKRTDGCDCIAARMALLRCTCAIQRPGESARDVNLGPLCQEGEMRPVRVVSCVHFFLSPKPRNISLIKARPIPDP